MNDLIISLLCFIATLCVYFLNKRLYRRWRKLLLMPLVLTPLLLVGMLLLTHISGRIISARAAGCCGCSARRRWRLRCRSMKT